ncbi:hypothetical protein C8A00DRAFT_36917 [Chaetomidium leptoderma]|uniref:Uncharacterized protein n=1 Tax=Chaetomidium leptoderma TaxID=669021 RepID=A0AAN6VH78_9PEZI|nr:hypothetical protein C8A00DRAFT_36917 [Chaetomidium leptoderma]
MPAEIDTKSNNPEGPVGAWSKEAAEASPTSTEQRKEPWRALPEFKSTEDNVNVSKVRDMRLFGNHVNAHS